MVSPDGALLAVGGFYAFSGKLSLFGILLFSWLGAWSTFILAYLLGNSIGRRVFNLVVFDGRRRIPHG